MKSDGLFERLKEVSFFNGSFGVVMGSTFYLLRQDPDSISSSLFRASDADLDVVFVEQAASIASSSMKGVVVTTGEMEVGLSHPTMTYDDLIEKIFSFEHIIVV